MGEVPAPAPAPRVTPLGNTMPNKAEMLATLFDSIDRMLRERGGSPVVGPDKERLTEIFNDLLEGTTFTSLNQLRRYFVEVIEASTTDAGRLPLVDAESKLILDNWETVLNMADWLPGSYLHLGGGA